MLSFLIISVILGIGLLLFLFASDDDAQVAGLCIAFGALIVVACMILAVVVTHCDTWFFEEHEKLNMKLTQTERMGVFEIYDFEKTIIEHNAKLATYKVKTKNGFSNWFYPKALANLEPLLLPATKALE